MARTTPPVDDMQSVLAVVINSSLDARQVRDWTGLSWERTQRALRELSRRDLARSTGGQWASYQRKCARCDQRSSGGSEIMIDGETLRWFCVDCWTAEAEDVRNLVNPDPEGGV
jgi:hypothetical protein